MGDFLGHLVSGLTGFIGDFFHAVVGAIAAVVDGVVSLLPNAANLGITVPSGFIVGYNLIDTLLPLHEAIAMVGIVLGVEVAISVWRLAVTIYHLIPKPAMGT